MRVSVLSDGRGSRRVERKICMSIFEVFDWADAEEVQFKHKLNAETTRVQAELEALDRAEEAAKLLGNAVRQHGEPD